MTSLLRDPIRVGRPRPRTQSRAALGLGALLSIVVAGGAFTAPFPPATLGAVGCVVESPAPSAAAPGAVLGVSMTVSDLERSIEFYTLVLDFRVESREERSGDAFERLTGVPGASARAADLRLGEERVELVEFRMPRGREIPGDSRSNDGWFQHIAIAVSEMETAVDRLMAGKVRFASVAPQTLPSWNPDAGGIGACYFNDPDGHVLEVIHFPPGKGSARWQRRSAGQVFLGIDHTAIVVSDTEKSLRFYRDALGLRVAGGSENSGIEQERLNNVFGAHLWITTLRADSGPGVELLEYLSPTTGRDMPRDSSAADLWHWHIVIRPEKPTAGDALRAARARWVSAPPAGERVPQATFRVRDPDGHVCQIQTDSDPSHKDHP